MSELEEKRGLDIANLAEGALVERGRYEIQKILDNIADPNTEIKKKRKLTMELTFIPKGENRDQADIEMVVKSSISPYRPVLTQIYMCVEDKKVVAEEYTKGQTKGQISLDEVTIVDQDGVIVSEPKNRKILNLESNKFKEA